MLKRKYIELSEIIESDVESKKWEDKLPGVHALAKHYNVAPATISKAVKVLSQKGRITIKGTKGAFISKKPNNRPRYGVIGEVGLVHRHGENKELQKIESRASLENMGVLTIGTSLDLSDAAPTFYAQLPVDGLIFTNSILRKPIIAELRKAGMPFVSVNRIFDTEGVDWVDYNTPKALEKALEELSELGHSRIAIVGFKQNIPGLLNELKSIHAKFCKENNVEQDMLWYENETNTEYWYKYGENYCYIYGVKSCNDLLSMDQPPTAAVILADSIAEGFCQTLKKSKNLNLPEDFPIITFSKNSDLAEDCPLYGKTVIPSIERAVTATEILFKKINTDQILTPVQTLLPMKLVTKQQ